MDGIWLTVLLSNDRWLFIEYFLGFVKSVCVFIHLCLWFQSVCCSPPWPLLLSALFRHAHRYYFKFFCTQENSFPFPFVLKWCVFISLLHLPFMSLSLGCGRAVHSLLSAVHRIRKITLLLVSASSQPCLKVLAVFLCFIKCPYSTETVNGVFKENLLSVRSQPPQLRIRRLGMFHRRFCWKPDRTPQRWKLQHTGELFETHFWFGSLPWKPDWYKAQI